MSSYISPEERVPLDHPLRSARPSIAAKRLLRALLLQTFYSNRSEGLLMEQLNHNLLFRWFVGTEMDEKVWNHALFSKNRERLLNEEIAEGFFQRGLRIAQPYLSDERFTVDRTMTEAWASHKSLRPKEEGSGNGEKIGEVNFHGERRANATHRCTTDPDSRLYKKTRGSEARICCLDHGLMKNRNGLMVKTSREQLPAKAPKRAGVGTASPPESTDSPRHSPFRRRIGKGNHSQAAFFNKLLGPQLFQAAFDRARRDVLNFPLDSHGLADMGMFAQTCRTLNVMAPCETLNE